MLPASQETGQPLSRSRLWFKSSRSLRRRGAGLTPTTGSIASPAVKPVAKTGGYDPLQDNLGLTVLHEPENTPTVDIVLVHGLGGKSQRTWAREGRPELFWPKLWLPKEETIKSARISTFGYDADFGSRGAKRTWTIADFANDLLFELDLVSTSLPIGEAPVIFIAHSMGGLVVKKACILGTSVLRYRDIAKSTRAIMFLSTPHYGSDLADWLRLVLGLSFLGHSSKPYISELKQNSLTLREINNQFLSLAPRPAVASFYETMETSVGPVKTMILGKESSIFGFEGEIVKALNADHHEVCKYTSIRDQNYINVRDVLRKFVNQYQVKGSRRQDFLSTQELRKVQKLLGISSPPDDDQEDFYKYYMPGSCQRFISGHEFQSWVNNPSGSPCTIWVNGPSGVGKSVLASCIVRHLKERGLTCHFYYFRFGDQEKRLLDTFFRSLAYQVANDIYKFREQLGLLSESRDLHRTGNGANVWRLFNDKFLELTLAEPMYWVVDAIDECESPAMLLKIMGPILSSGLPLRVMFLSRRTDLLATSFQELARPSQLAELNMEADHNDLAQYVREKVKKIRVAPEAISFREEIGNRILRSAEGNFLWARLVTERVLQCKRRGEIETALKELPPELESLYQRMEETLNRTLTDPDDVALARMTLMWAICSRRHLTMQELSEALQPDASSILDLPSYIDQVCGGFIIVDSHTSRVTVVHHSAQDYLTNVSMHFRIETPYAHRLLFEKCLSVLFKLRSNFPQEDLSLKIQLQRDPLLQYAASSWFHHLLKSEVASAETSFHLLAKFLNGPCNLVWISIVASSGQLQPIVEAAEALDSFLLQQQQQLASEVGTAQHLLDSARTVQRWAIDLLQITAKFGDHLVRYPRAIYCLIQAFCPVESGIHKSRYRDLASGSSMAVTGLVSADWDDCLARFSVKKDCNASKILCTDDYFAVSTFLRGRSVDGSVSVYRTRTCEELHTLLQGEPVHIMQFSASARLLATSGTRNIKIWTIPMDPGGVAQILCTLPNPGISHLLAIAFTLDDQSLIICSHDGIIRRRSLSSSKTGWDFIGLAIGGVDTFHSYPPSCAAFNRDASLIAVGFRGAPTTVWELAPFRRSQWHQRGNRAWTGVIRVEWNIRSGHVIGLYDDGCVFKWNVAEMGQVDEIQAGAINIKCNTAGDFFATSSGNSKLTVWDFEHFRPVYQLSLPAGVVDLAINPDGRRIYDLRESYCTIWQPLSLVRRGESLRSDRSQLDALLGIAQEALPPGDVVTIPADITALAVSPKSAAYCTGNMAGALQIVSEEGKKSRYPPSFKSPIELVAWSWDETYLAIARFGNSISVRAAEPAAADEGKMLDEKLDAPVRQLLFNKSSNILFVATPHSLYIWAIEGQPRLVSKRLVHKQCRWVNHPSNNQLLLGFAFDTLSALRWKDLQQEFQLDIKSPETSYVGVQDAFEPSARATWESIASVNKVFTNCDGSITFLQISQSFLTHNASDEFFILHDVGINSPGSDATRPNKLVPLPRHLQALIHIPLGFINAGLNVAALYSSTSVTDTAENHLAFLSNEGWISTMYLGGKDVPDRVKSHYFLPRDWLVEDALELAQITASGTLFCPKNGEVGIVWNGLGTEWAG